MRDRGVRSGDELGEVTQHRFPNRRLVLPRPRAQLITHGGDDSVGKLLREILADQLQVHPEELGGHRRLVPVMREHLPLEDPTHHRLDGDELLLHCPRLVGDGDRGRTCGRGSTTPREREIGRGEDEPPGHRRRGGRGGREGRRLSRSNRGRRGGGGGRGRCAAARALSLVRFRQGLRPAPGADAFARRGRRPGGRRTRGAIGAQCRPGRPLARAFAVRRRRELRSIGRAGGELEDVLAADAQDSAALEGTALEYHRVRAEVAFRRDQRFGHRIRLVGLDPHCTPSMALQLRVRGFTLAPTGPLLWGTGYERLGQLYQTHRLNVEAFHHFVV